jgi:ABC-type Na+ transport system ATPase subunit NatA
LLTPGDKIQNGLKMEKSRAFRLAGFSDGHATEVTISRALI